MGGKENTNGGDGKDENLMLDSIGCTANVIMINDDCKILHIANAGDSRSVLARNGKAFPLSFDHKPENAIERARIEKAGSVITEGRVDGNLNLSRSIGDMKYKQKEGLNPDEHPITANPDTTQVELTPEDDFIVMGCDGIWEQKSNQEMVDYIYDKMNKGETDLKNIISDLLNDIISPDYTQTSKFKICELCRWSWLR